MQQQHSLLKQFIRFSTATVASLMVFSLYSIVDWPIRGPWRW